MTDTAKLHTYKIDADPRDIDVALVVLATDGSARILTTHYVSHHVLANARGVRMHIAAAATGVLIARGWIINQHGGAWVISEEGALEYNRRVRDRAEVRAAAQADRDHNI